MDLSFLPFTFAFFGGACLLLGFLGLLEDKKYDIDKNLYDPRYTQQDNLKEEPEVAMITLIADQIKSPLGKILFGLFLLGIAYWEYKK